MLTPLVDFIEWQWPGARVDIIAGGRMEEIFSEFPSVRRCIESPHPALKLLFNPHYGKLIRNSYDLSINVDADSQSGRLTCRIINAPSTVHAGAPDSIDSAASNHMALRPIEALCRWAVLRRTEPDPAMSLRLTEAERRHGVIALSELLDNASTDRPVIGLYPYANKKRDYPLEWWQQLIEEFRRQMPSALLVEIQPATGQALLDHIDRRMLSCDLRALATQLAAMDAVIAVDGGVMHLASASGTLTWGLFRVTESNIYAPYGGHNRAWNFYQAKPSRLASELTARLAAAGRLPLA